MFDNYSELAFQISEQFRVLGASVNLHSTVIVGGMDMMTQAIELRKRPHVIIATPGRLVDLIRSNQGEWSLNRVKFLVSLSHFILSSTKNWLFIFSTGSWRSRSTFNFYFRTWIIFPNRSITSWKTDSFIHRYSNWRCQSFTISRTFTW